MDSLERTSSSIATSLPLPDKVGPVYFTGLALISFQLWTARPVSSRSVMVALDRSAAPVLLACVIQSHKLEEFTTPRFKVMSLTVVLGTGRVARPPASRNSANRFDGPECRLK